MKDGINPFNYIQYKLKLALILKKCSTFNQIFYYYSFIFNFSKSISKNIFPFTKRYKEHEIQNDKMPFFFGKAAGSSKLQPYSHFLS